MFGFGHGDGEQRDRMFNLSGIAVDADGLQLQRAGQLETLRIPDGCQSFLRLFFRQFFRDGGGDPDLTSRDDWRGVSFTGQRCFPDNIFCFAPCQWQTLYFRPSLSIGTAELGPLVICRHETCGEAGDEKREQ